MEPMSSRHYDLSSRTMSETCLKRPLKKEITNVLKPYGIFMQVKSTT